MEIDKMILNFTKIKKISNFFIAIELLSKCSVSFCCTTKVNQLYTYIPSLLDTPQPRVTTLSHHWKHQAELLSYINQFYSLFYFVHDNVYMSMQIS